MAVGIKRKLSKVLENVNHDIHLQAKESHFGNGALSAEGYNGGYADAIMDVELALNGIQPKRRNWWNDD
uniref:Uncharacterized protein n=1 Tax=viral metagenome TaxID=1070528 RepID=A0A6M3X4J5_9ZZZZ